MGLINKHMAQHFYIQHVEQNNSIKRSLKCFLKWQKYNTGKLFCAITEI